MALFSAFILSNIDLSLLIRYRFPTLLYYHDSDSMCKPSLSSQTVSIGRAKIDVVLKQK